MSAIKTTINQPMLKQAAKLIRAIAHPLRLEILEYIDGKKTTNVRPIVKDLHLDQSICSQHLKILRDTNLVIVERTGKEKHYSLNYDHIQSINTTLVDFFTIKA